MTNAAATCFLTPRSPRRRHGPSLCAIETDARARDFNSVPQGDLRQLRGDLVATAFSRKCMGLQSAVTCAGTETAQRRAHTPAKEVLFFSEKCDRNKNTDFLSSIALHRFASLFFLPPPPRRRVNSATFHPVAHFSAGF